MSRIEIWIKIMDSLDISKWSHRRFGNAAHFILFPIITFKARWQKLVRKTKAVIEDLPWTQ